MADGTYIGDAVYADFDGWNLWLRTGDGNNNEIALEPEVWKALLGFMQTTRDSYLDYKERDAFDRMFPTPEERSTPDGVAGIDFTPDEFRYLADELRRNGDHGPAYKALLSNNYNVILAALDKAALSKSQEPHN